MGLPFVYTLSIDIKFLFVILPFRNERRGIMKQQIRLSDHFSVRRMLRFTMPSIIMMIFTSIYGVVDGFFVSNFVGKTEFAAVNFIMPVLMILGAFGFMLGSGGSAIVACTLGQGRNDQAQKQFSLFVYAGLFLGAAMAVLGFVLIEPIAVLLGAEGEMLEYCVTYGRILSLASPAYLLQFEFQTFFITAEKPKLGLYMTLVSGVMNMVLDALFMAVFRWGVVGAAFATAISQFIGAIVPLVYFLRPNTSLLRLVRTNYVSAWMLKACVNGSSELMSNISFSLVGMLYNFQLMKYAGEDGVAAYGVLMYVNMIFIAVFIGFSTGMAPVVGYHFGAENHDELKSLLRKSLGVIGVCSVAMLLLGEVCAYPLSYIFVGYDESLMSITLRGFMIYSFSFLFAGLAIFGSAFFTALSDGVTSAVIAFLRTLVFQVAAVLILPIFFELDGVWFSIVAAEIMATVITVLFLAIKKNKYKYR